MIPRKIHYCWFGMNPLPADAERCIASWRKFFPDYEIIEWNEQNFDVNTIPYTAEAYERKKYAFVSDYARFYILYHYGGIYFDTDVEVLKPFDEIISRGSYMGCERDAIDEKDERTVNPGLGMAVAPGLGMAVPPGLGIIKELLDYYESIHFIKPNGEIDTDTVVAKTTRILKLHGLQEVGGIQDVEGIYIYPKIYFCPGEAVRKTGKYDELTYSAHHYTASWRDKKANKREKNPIWRLISKAEQGTAKMIKQTIGLERWANLRDRYLKRLYNFFRGV